MSKVAEYYTECREYSADERSVYHNQDTCEFGGRIDPAHRNPGRGSGDSRRQLCMECARLSARTDGSCATWF